ncbi:acyl-CoA dehydrogenase family protein [Advenella alkanexedens]|uniref:Acyl-CoA dehydrogenase family protein n=1 Tax=Advenella alkanexedens TaxID=1481665 RepID=A0ABS6NPC2_9BURK|nr:acyl-CoA dehydrogenase family protein [Advenella alkanexedens]MBV4397031.1 acyl-CoA dehydrogenase family protein [Advenella alkanexedens]
MDLNLTQEDIAFREEVRQFVATSLPQDIKDKVFKHQRLDNNDYIRWHRVLDDHGWGAPSWPVEFGGTGWSALQKLIFEIESFKGGAPRLLPFGLSMIGPVLMKYASPEMQRRFLPRMLRIEDWWCQGYSEPGSGSDLASLKTRAEKTPEGYVVNGQKTWTTLGQYADWMFCLVRTDPDAKPQRGISMLLIDMRQPGVTVRPIKTLDGGHDVNEVWLENVKVPYENLVGNENEGWTYAKYLLGHERTGIAGIGLCYRELQILKNLAAEVQWNGKPANQDVRMKDRISLIEADILSLEMMLLRVAADSTQGPGPQASVLKIRGSEIQQDLARLQLEVMGLNSWPYSPSWLEAGEDVFGPGHPFAAAASANYFDMRKTTIYGGTTEVQKSIIAKQILDV